MRGLDLYEIIFGEFQSQNRCFQNVVKMRFNKRVYRSPRNVKQIHDASLNIFKNLEILDFGEFHYKKSDRKKLNFNMIVITGGDIYKDIYINNKLYDFNQHVEKMVIKMNRFYPIMYN